MKVPASLMVVSFVFVSTACLFPLTDQLDGASCSEGSECRSGHCVQGYCAGSSCRRGDSSSCEPGWRCEHVDPDVISAAFGSTGSYKCKPTCGYCPGNSYCRRDQPVGEALCSLGKAPLDLQIQASSAVVGRSATVVATPVSPAGRIVNCEWEWGDGAPRETTPGPEVVHTFQSTAGRLHVRVLCRDEAGRTGSAQEAIDVACQPNEGECVAKLCCASTGYACLPEPSSGVHVCRAPRPLTVAISAPSTLSVYQEGTFTVTMTEGDGELGHATWSFEGRLAERRGQTVSHSFSRPGKAKVNVNAATVFGPGLIGPGAEAVHEVVVCQTENGRCSASEPCCSPLSCQTSGGLSRCVP